MSKRNRPPKPPGTGKAANDRNKGPQAGATPTHEAQRSPESRNDRESAVGRQNQTMSRRKGPG